LAKHKLTVDPASKSYRRYLGPKYWPIWLGLALLWLLTRLPFGLQMRIGSLLGAVTYYFTARRRKITEINVALCFPHLDTREKTQLVKRVFVAQGKGLIETAMSWFLPQEYFYSRVSFEGLEHLRAAKASGRGIILAGGHFAIIDLFGALLSPELQPDMIQRNHNNPLMDLFMTRARESFGGRCISRRDLRSIVRGLKAGRSVWYAPDQDYGRKDSVFVPFFSVPTATITTTSGLARLGKAVVLPAFPYRTPDNKYRIRILPPLNIPGESETQDAADIMAFIEKCVKEFPDQYLWMHRRFKTRPEGDKSFY